MDWRRAKSILIFSFLLLNLLLGYQLWLDIREQFDASVTTAELPPETQSIMKEKRIQLKASLPVETPALQDVTYRYKADGPPEARVKHELAEPVDSKVIFSPVKDMLKALSGQIPDLAKYEYDPNVRSDKVFVLYRMNEGLPMFKVKLELYYSNQKITSYSQDTAELTGTVKGKQEQVLPASKVAANLIENHLADGAIITNIRLGYHGQIFDSETQLAAPSWRVLLDSGDIYYVHAISGKVVKDNDAPEAERP
ncbi:two-component system regulatory protein YycI [Paenibacillus sp. GCM10023252]|uniref:two-component system regulatory protein YycI n=1 Tax=Paenibacillus sp. GCM10023252 TaxID=3252649 RepID=UPI00361EDECA